MVEPVLQLCAASYDDVTADAATQDAESDDVDSYDCEASTNDDGQQGAGISAQIRLSHELTSPSRILVLASAVGALAALVSP